MPYAIACVTWGTEEKLKSAIAAGDARLVVRNQKQFVQWDTFEDSITQGIDIGFKAEATKSITKEMYKQMTDNLKASGLSLDLPQKGYHVMERW